MFDLNSATVRTTSVLADAQRDVMLARYYERIASGNMPMEMSDMARAARTLTDEGFGGCEIASAYADAADALAWRRESAEYGSGHWEALCLAEGLARRLA